MMRSAVAIALLACVSYCLAGTPPIPLQSGTYQFQWKDAEFSDSAGFPVKVVIDGIKVSVVKEHAGGAAPLGELESAVLMWNTTVHKWVLGYSEADKTAPDPGGCSGEGPHVIDFDTRVIWTCEWGP
jgi:hypothetical protein